MPDAQVKKGFGTMSFNGSVLRVIAILAVVMAAGGAMAASLTLNGAGTAKAGDTITFTTDNTWAGTSISTVGNATEIRYLNAGGSLVAGIPLNAGNVAGWSFAGGAIIGGSFVLPAQLDSAITQVELQVTTNAEGPVISTNRRAVDVVAPTAQTLSVANSGIIGGSYNFVIQDNGVADNDVVGAGVVVQINQDGVNNWQALPNQTPGGWTGGTGSTVVVDFAAIDANDNGFIEEVTAVANGSVSIRIVVSDPAGNSAILGPFTSLTVDALAPTVLSITTMTTTTIRVVFSEEVSSGATTPANYTVSGGNFVAVGGAALSTTTFNNDTVTLTLGVAITSSATPSVTVANVRDLGTNIVSGAAPNGTAATDGIKPTLLSAKQNTYAGTNTILLEFDEPIQAGVVATQFTVGAGDISNVVLTQNPSGLGNQFFQFNNASANTPLVAGTTVAAQATILDAAGNGANTVPVTLQLIPSVQSANYTAADGASQYYLSIVFSKTINRTSFINALAAGHLTVTQADGTTGSLVLNAANTTLVTAVDAATMVLKVFPSVDSSLITFNGLGLIKLQLASGTVSDGSLLAIAATGTDITVAYTPDATAPLLDVGNPIIQRKSVAVTGTTVDITFDDYILQSSLVAGDFLLNGVTGATSANVLTTGSLAGYSVRLVFAGGVDTDALDGDAVDDLDVNGGVVANNQSQFFAGTSNQAITTDAAATSTITQGAAPGSTTLVAATVHGTPANVFNFTVTDAGADSLPTNFDSIQLEVFDTTGNFVASSGNITWRLTGGSLGAAVTGVVGGASPNYTLTFSGLAQSVANAASANFAISVQILAAASVPDGAQFQIRRLANNAHLVSTGGSTFVAAVGFNGSTITYDVVATKLAFVTVDGGGVGGFPTSTAFTTNKSVNVAFGTWALHFVDANNMLDTGANGPGAQVTVSNVVGGAPAFGWNLVQPALGQVDPALGVATFGAGTAMLSTQPANDISLSFATVYAPAGAIAAATTTNTFDIRPDTNSTLTESSSPASFVENAAANTVWALTLTDAGTADGLSTVLTSITINAVMGGTAGLNLSNFTWSLLSDNDGPGGVAAVTFNAAGPAATSGTLVFTGAPLITVANGTAGTLTLQASTLGLAASTVLDGVTFDFSVANSASFEFGTSGDLVFQQVSSLVTNGTNLNNTTNTAVSVVATHLSNVTHPDPSPAHETVAVAFPVAVAYVNVNGHRDLNVNGDVLTAKRDNTGGAVVGSGAAASGLASFNVTFAAPGDITNTLNVHYEDDAAGIVDLSAGGSHITSNPFLLRNSDDADSTLTDQGAPAASIPSTGGPHVVWTIRLEDSGLSDGKATILTGLTILATLGTQGTNDVDDFDWTITDGVMATPATGVANNGTNEITFTGMSITAPNLDQPTVGTRHVDFQIRVTPSTTMTDRTNVHNMTLNLQITAATTSAAGTSLNPAELPHGPTGNIPVIVTATKLSFNPTSFNSISSPALAGTGQTIEVWYTDANTNLAKGQAAATVTAARSDSFSFFPDPNPSVEGGVNDLLSISKAHAAGISSFSVAEAINLAGRASPSTTITIDFTDTTNFGATVLSTNAFLLNSRQEATLSAGGTAEAAAVSSIGPAANLLDFNIADTGNDDINTRITQIVLDMSTSTSGAGNVTGMLGDVDVVLPIQGDLTAAVTGTVSGTTLVFDLLAGGNTGIVIADGGNETYQFTALPKATKWAVMRDGDVLRASLSHAASFTADPLYGRISSAVVTVSNAGMTVNVVASQLRWVNVTGNLPTEVREGDIVRDSLNNTLSIEYTDANGNRDLNATDTITVFWSQIDDASQAAEVRADGTDNTVAAVSGLVDLSAFIFQDNGAGAGVGGVNGNVFFVDDGAGVLAGAGAFTSPNLTLGTVGTDVLRLSFGGAGTFTVRNIDDRDSTFTVSTVTADIPVGGAEVAVYRADFTDTGFTDLKNTIVKELRFNTVFSGGGLDATMFDWRISPDNGTTFVTATGKAATLVTFVHASNLFTVNNGTTTQLRLYATALTTAGNVNSKTAADNQTLAVTLDPALSGVVLDAGGPSFTGTSLSAAQAAQADPGNDTVRVTATQLVFASYTGGSPAGDGSASIKNHQLGVQGGTITVDFADAANNRDLDHNTAGSAITVTRSDVAGGFAVTGGSLTPALGVASFALTFNTQRAGWTITNNANRISLAFSQGALTTANTDLFNVHSDATSTITQNGNATTTLDDNNTAFQTVWVLNVNDLGSFDGLPTILDSLVITGSVSGGTYNFTHFNWQAVFQGGGTVAPNTVTATTLTWSGPALINVANNTSGTITLQAQTGLVTSSTTFDGITIDLNVASTGVSVLDATNSSTFSAFPAVNNVTATPGVDGGNTRVNVAATRLVVSPTVYPGDGNTPNVPMGEERVNVDFTMEVFYQNENQNRDTDVTGDIVTVARSDGAGNINQGSSAAAAAGVASFSGANAVDLANPANVSGTLLLTATDDLGAGSVTAAIIAGDTPTFILRTFDDANSRIEETVGQVFNNTLWVKTGGSNTAIRMWSLDVTDLETSDPVPTIVEQLIFNVGIAGPGANTINDVEWTLVTHNGTFVGAANTGLGTVTFQSNFPSPLLQAGDSDLNTNGTADTKVIELFGRVKVPGSGGSVTDPATIDGTTLTISLGAIAGGPPTVYTDGNAANNEDSTSFNTAFAPVSGALNRSAGIVTIQVVATQIRELASSAVTGLTRSSNVAFALGCEYTDEWGYRDRDVAGDTVTLVREDGTNLADPANTTNTLPVSAHAFKGAGVIISGGTATAALGVVNFNVNLGYPGFLTTDAGHRLFFVDDNGGSIDLFGAEGAGQPYATGQFGLDGVNEATITDGLGAESAFVSSEAAGPAVVLDFRIVDAGTDALSTDVTEITITVGGTAVANEGTWYLDGPDFTATDFNGAGVRRSTGVQTGNQVRFGVSTAAFNATDSGSLPIRVGDNTGAVQTEQSETYRILFRPTAGALTTQDNQYWTVTVDSLNFVFDDVAGTGRANSLTVDNTGVGGLRYDVTANTLSFGALSGPLGAPTGSTVAGVAFGLQPDFRASDTHGNRDLDYNSTITAVITTNPGGATLAGTTTVSFAAGVASFSGLSMNKVGTGYIITYTTGAPALPTLTSPAFDITAAAAHTAEVSVQPTSTVAGNLLATSPVVRLLDAFGNIATATAAIQFTATVVAPAGGTNVFDANDSINGANGFGTAVASAFASVGIGQSTATFTGLRLNRAATGYALNFAATVNTNAVSVNSALFNITPGAAASVSVSGTFADPHLGNVSIGGVAPAGATAGANFTTQPVAVLLDALGNVRTNDSSTQVQVTIDAPGGLYTGPSVVGRANNTNVAGTLQGLNSQTVTAVNGVVNFSGTGLRIDEAATNYTLRFHDTASQYATDATSVITVLPGAGALLQMEENPAATAVAGVAIAGANTAVPTTSIRISIRDNFGNVVTSNSSTVVSAAFGANPSSGTATLGGTTSVTVSQGVANFSTLTVDKAFANYTLVFSGGLPAATSTAFTITPAPTSQFVILQQPTSLNAGIAFLPSPSVQLKDQFGNNTTNDSTSTVLLAIQNNAGVTGALRLTTNLAATVASVTATASAGVVTFNNVTLDKVGSGYTLRFDGVSFNTPDTISAAFNVNPGAPSKLYMSQQPQNTVAGVSITPAPQVQIHDQFDNHVTTDNTTTVNAAVGLIAGVTFGGNTSATANAGTATFNNLFITTANVGYRADFTSTGLTGINSNLFNITHAPASKIEVTTQPGNTNTDSVIPGFPTARLLDTYNNIASTDSSTVVNVQIGTNPGGGTLYAGVLSKSVVNGVASFADLKISKKGTGYTLSFTGSSLTSIATNAFNVVAGTPVTALLTVQPASGTAGAPFGQPRVEIYDANANLTDNNSTVNITAAIGTNPGSGTINTASTTTIQVTNGVANWGALPLGSQLRIDRAGTGYTLLFTATGGVSSVTSNAFNIAHAAASQLALTTHPNGATAGQSFNVQPVVEIRDAFNNRVSSDSISLISVAFVLDGPGGSSGSPIGNANGVLQGPPSQPVSFGIANFSGLRIDQAGVGYSLRFSSGALTVADSNLFNVNHAAPSQLVVTTHPAGALGGAQFTTQPVVEIRDPFQNVATTSSLTVTGSLGADPTNGSSGFAGGPSLAATNGVVDFALLAGGNRFRINKAANGYRMGFSASGLTTVNSDPFNVLVGPAATINITTQPDGFRAVVDNVVQPFDTQPVVELLDLGGNLVIADNTTTVTAAINSSVPSTPGVPVLGGVAAQQSAAGIVTWTDLSISVAGDYTLVFTGPGLTQAISATFTLEAGPLILQTIALDDHDNNGQVSAGDRLLFVWDEELQVASVPLVNATGQLDSALGLSGGVLGATATAEIRADGRSIWVRVGTGETVTSGTTTAKPTTIRNAAGNLDTTPAPVAIGGPVTDTFAPRLLTLTVDGGSPSVLRAGTYEIVATYTDDQINPVINIVAPGTNDVVNGAMTPVTAGNLRAFRFSYTVGPANGTVFVDGPVTISVSNANDARGNVAESDVTLPYGVSFDTVNPAFASLMVGDADNCYRAGDAITVVAGLNEPDLTVTGDFTAADSSFGAAVAFTNNFDGTYTAVTPALSAATLIEGKNRFIMVTATDVAGNSTSFQLSVEVDNTAPVGTFTFNRPVTNVPSGDLLVTVSYSEDIYVRPELSINFAAPENTDIVAAPMTGSMNPSNRTFSYTLNIPAGMVDTATLTIASAADCAGNAAGTPGNNVLTITGGAPVLVANAGPDQILESLAQVTLDGSASVGAAAYAWTQLSGPAVTINNAGQAMATFSSKAGGDYVFQLEVVNGANSATDAVMVRVPNYLPTVSVAGDVNIDAGQVAAIGNTAKVGLSGSVLDLNEDSPIVTQWVLVDGPSDGNLTIATPGSLSTALAVTGAAMVGGVYEFELRAWDPAGLANGQYGSARVRYVVVSSTRIAPAAHAGLDLTVNVGTAAQLSGNESSDPNAAVPAFPALIYSWAITSAPAGSGAMLSSTISKTPVLIPDLAGVYEVTLTVTDAESLKSGTDTVIVTAIAPPATGGAQAGMVRAQVTVTGSDDDNNGVINTGEVVTMDASRSPTANPAAVLTFTWLQLAGPESVVLTSATGGVQTFTPTLAGNYQFKVTPNDGLSNGIPALVHIKVAAAGTTGPVALAAVDSADDPDNNRRIFYVPGFGVDLNLGNLDINISGAGSTSGPGVTYQWRQVAGPTVGVMNADSLVMSFRPILSRLYAFELTVTDGGVSATARINLTIDTFHPVLNPVGNLVPSATATGVNGEVAIQTTAGRLVSMVGSGFDANNDLSGLIFTWVQTSGAPVVLIGANTPNPSFVPPVPGRYTFELHVDDGNDIGEPAVLNVDVAPFVVGPTDPGAVGSSSCSMATGSNGSAWAVLMALLALAGVATVVARRRKA